MTRCVVNFADRDYVRWQNRLTGSLSKHGNSVAHLIWTDSLPPGSPKHSEWPYAFKLYAIKDAMAKGHTTILWVDAGLYAVRPLDPLFDAIEEDGVYAVREENTVGMYCSDETLAYFGITREEAKPIHLASGAILGFDFRQAIAKDVFGEWFRAFEASLYRGTVSKHSGQQDHRGDESILGLIFHHRGLRFRTLAEHFSADCDLQPKTVFRSGYYERKD